MPCAGLTFLSFNAGRMRSKFASAKRPCALCGAHVFCFNAGRKARLLQLNDSVPCVGLTFLSFNAGCIARLVQPNDSVPCVGRDEGVLATNFSQYFLGKIRGPLGQ